MKIPFKNAQLTWRRQKKKKNKAENRWNKYKIPSTSVDFNSTISVITLSELNSPIKRLKIQDQIKEKIKIHLHAVYKKYALVIKIQMKQM